jgi:hypothetical protein
MRINLNLKQIKSLPPRVASLLAVVVLLTGLVFPVLLGTRASAASAQLQSRSLKISSSANGTITQDIGGNAVPAGDGGNGQKTKETFKFTVQSTQNVATILFKFCDDPIPLDATSGPGDGTCNAPTGFSATTVASIISQTVNGGAIGTPFTIDNSTVLTGAPWGCAGASPGRQNCIAITRTATSVTSGDIYEFAFGGLTGDYITNPTADNDDFFSRIQLYNDTGFSTKGDYGSVAASTAQQIDITAKVKEVLNFSVAANAANVTAPGTTCSPLTTGAGTGAMQLGDVNGVLSFNQAYDAHSYFRISTNTNGGVQVLYSGDTLKNGGNSIAAIGTTATASAVNTAQFGLAIDSGDTTPNGYNFTSGLSAATVGSPAGSITDYSGGAGTITNGGTATFAFNTGSKTTPIVLAYAGGPVACNTGSVRYLGNISTATPAGIYTTTITYIATGIY